MDSDGAAPGWTGRVVFSEEGGGIAYRPGELLVAGEHGLDVARRLLPETLGPEEALYDEREVGQVYRLRIAGDPLEAVHDLRMEGVVAQPNHVLFAHGGSGCCGPHPSHRFHASPFHASPFHASPFHASPFHASPFHASPFHASDVRATGRRRSSARPSVAPVIAAGAASGGTGSPRIVVLDTGFAAEALRPPVLQAISVGQQHWEEPDEDLEGHLDPVAGHGTFIAGLIHQLAPGCDIAPERVLTTMGDGDEAAIAQRIDDLAASGVDLLNLSFGGYALERPHVLAAAIRKVQAAGTVVVASAGNDATCRPPFPAALPGVIGVGAVGPDGPAPFTNHGAWVRACAPGVDLVGPFFDGFDGPELPAPGGDPDAFDGWARWSGTSFAAPVVVAALAREMRRSGVSAREAVDRVVDAPGLLRIPDLGTVVNIQ